MALSEWARSIAERQAVEKSAKNGEYAAGGVHYLDIKDFAQVANYKAQQRVADFYNTTSGLQWLSQDDEEKRRKQLEALRNDSLVRSRKDLMSVLDYTDSQISNASRYRSYDEWGQATGDKTYIGQLQSQLDDLETQINELQGKDVNLFKLGWANLTKNANPSGQNPNDRLDLNALGAKTIFGRDDDSTEAKLADAQAKYASADRKLKNAALNTPTDKYDRYNEMSTEELGLVREELERQYAKDVEENPWKHLTNEQAMQIVQGGGASSLRSEAKTTPNEIRYIDQLLEQRERQAAFDELYANKLNDPNFDGSYDSNVEDVEYKLVNNKLEGMEAVGSAQYKLNNPVNQMTDEERSIYNSVYKNEGREAASEFLSFLNEDLNLRQRLEDEATAREYAQESPVGASFLSVISRLASPVEAGAQITHLAMGDYDENAFYNAASRFTTNVRDQVSRDITADSGETWAWVYNTGMSVADNLAQMGLGGGAGTLMMMGTAVFSDALVQGRDAGLSDSEIIADATVRALIEIATEKIGLDEVMKVVKGAGGMQVLRAALAEGGEEAMSNLGNLFYDEIKATVTGRESEIKEEVEKLMDAGYSESEAAAIVIGNKAKDLGLDTLSGFVSGLAMSGGSYVGSISLEKAERYAKETFDGSVEKALTLGDDSDVFKMAEQFQNEPPTNRMMKEVAKIKLINATDKATAKLLKESTDAYAKELESVDVEELPKKVEEIANRIVMESKGATQEASTEVDEEGNETKETKEKSDLGKTDILLAALGAARIRVFENKLRDQILKTNATTEEGSVDMADKILRLGENATIQLSNGEIIDLNNLDFKGDGALNAAYKNAVQGLRRTSDANTYISDFKSLNGQVSAQFFDTLWKTAYKMHGATVENVKSSEAVATLLSAYEEVARADGVEFNMGAIDTVIKHAQQMGNESAIRVTEASKKLVNEMAALTNTKVEFVDNLVDKDGNSVQGLYDTETKTIKISTTTRNPATVVFCHELTHAMQDANPEVYALYKKAVLRKLSSNGANYTFIETQVKKSYPKREGQSTEEWMDEVNDEIVAIASENFLVESAFVNQLKKNKNVFRKVRNVILNRYQRVGIDIVRNRMNDMEKEDYEWFTKLTSLWVDIASQADLDEAALEEYRKELIGEEMPNGDLPKETMEEVKEKVEKKEVVTPQAETQFSREFDADFMDFADAKNIMSDTEYKKYKQIRKSKGEVKAQEYLDEIKDKVRNNLKKAAREALVDEATMQKAREVRNNTKQLLEQYKRFLPEDKMGKDWKTKNGSYDISGDLGTVCVRSLAVEPLMDFIADRIGHPLTAEETTFISQELMNYTHVPPCVYCYVAMDRNAKRDFLNAFINWREDTISNFRSGMAEEDVKKAFLKYNYKSGSRTMNDKLKARYNLWKKMAFDPSYEKISKADLTSVERMEERSKVSKSFAEQIKDAQDYAQSASYAKGVIGYTAYNNEILNWTPKRIRDLNAQYGMRMYSFTDYHPAFVLENMQMITDAAVKGLKVLAYTKEIDFARIFMRTGANINISIFAQSKMVDGTFHQDGMMGADWEQAKKARAESNKYGGNVGITMVAINDEQVEWACQQDWIDVVIPFHTVKAEQFADLNKWQNFKGVQEEKKLTKSDADYWAEDESWTPGDWKAGMKKEIMPQDHGNDYDTYIQACKDNHLKPKFEKWYQKWGVNGDATTRNWYMKLVVETRRSYTDTLPVQPIFNEAAAKESIRRMNKPWDAPIGETAEGYEDITVEEIAKDISDKMSSQTFSNSRLSRGFEDVGYHAGDLGKAESLFNQSGSRDTGHFGTGTYFVGDEEKINRYDYGKRPHEKVNFEKYNLFKPKNYSDANKLHQFMRRVDGWIGQYEGARSASEYNDYKEQLSDATYEFSENGQQSTIDDIDAMFFSDFESEERRSDSEIIDDVVRLARLTIGSRDLARVIADHSNRDVYASGDTLILDDGIYETEFTPEEYLKRVPRDTAENIMDWVDTEASDWRSNGLERAESYEDWHDTIEDVSEILGVSADTLESAITEATEEADTISYPDSTTADSIATRVMKRLGYEGVDVRHINDMDNTMYGSVIYDLKGEDLARKQEIGTARFSKEFDSDGNSLSEGQVRFFKNSKMRDENGNLKVMYHGTRGANFTVFDPRYSDDGISLFFTDDAYVASTYSGTQEIAELDKEYSYDELSELVESFSGGDVYIERTDSGYRLREVTLDGEVNFEKNDSGYERISGDRTLVESSDLDTIRDVFVNNYIAYKVNEPANYKVYLNLENPYVYEANERGWSYLIPENSIHVVMTYHEGDTYDDGTWEITHNGQVIETPEDFDIFTYAESIGDTELTEELEWDDDEVYLEGKRYETLLDEGGNYAIEWDNTRNVAEYAKEHGYDGVIFKNILDANVWGVGDGVSNVAVAFNSNQVKSVNNTNPTANSDYRYAREFEDEYIELAQDPEKNKARLQEMVDRAAEAAGYNVKAYHGTWDFGKTVFDRWGGVLYLTDETSVARNFSGGQAVRTIAGDFNPDTASLESLVEYAEQNTYADGIREATAEDFDNLIERNTPDKNDIKKYGQDIYDNEVRRYEIAKELKADFESGTKYLYMKHNSIANRQGFANLSLFPESRLREFIKEYTTGRDSNGGGVYQMYLRPNNMLEIDVRGNYYTDVPIPDELKPYATSDELKSGNATSDQILRMASEAGYETIKYMNMREGGDYGNAGISNVYATLNATENAKSADPVTYDDNGNIIPLSERFNKTNEDIRYSKEFTDEETNAVSSNDIKRVADVLSDADVSKVKLSDEQVRKIAERILRGRGSEYSTDDLAANLKKAFAYWTQNKGTNYAALVQVMQDFMMPVVESIYDYSGDQRRRDTLIGTTFVVSEEAAKKADIKNINRRLFGYGIAFTTDAESVSSDREVVNLAENWYHEMTDGSVDGVAIDLNIDHTLTDEAEMVEAIRDFVTTERGEAATQVVSPQFREGYAFDLALEAFQEFINESRVSIDEISRRANADAGKLVRENKNLRSRNAHLHDRIDQLRNEYKEKYLNMVAKNKDIIDRKKSSLQEQADKAKQLDRLQREWKRLDNYVNKPNRGRHINASYKKYLEYLADMVDLTTNRKSKRNDALDALADEYRRLSKLEQYEDRPYDDTIEMKLREVNDMVAGRPIRELNSSEIKEVVDVVRAFIKRATTMDEFTQKELARKYETVQEASRQTINNIDKSRGLTNKDSLADKWLTMQLSPMREVERLTDFHADDPLFLAAENILRAEIKVNEYKMNFALMFKEMQPNQYKRGTDEWKKAREFRKRYDKMNETYVKVRLGGVEREITEAQKLELIMQSRNEDSMRHILFGGLLVPDLDQLKKGHWNTAYTSGTIVRPFEIEMLRLSKGLDEFQKWFLDRSVKYFDYASKLINQTSFELEGFARAEVENYYPIRVATNYTSQKNYDVLTGMQDSGESIDSDMLKARVKSKLPIYLNGINQSLQRHQNFVSRYAALAIPMSDFQKIYGAKVREEVPKYYHDVLETINGMKGGSLVRDDVVKDFKEKFFMVTDADGNVVTGELKKEVLKAGNNKRGTRVQIGDNTYNIEDNVREALEWSGIALFLENRGKNVTKADILDFINNRGIPELNPVKNVLEAKWGHHATNYLNNALKDLAGNRPVEQGLLDKARGNAAQAILTLNPSVSIKQAASFPTAIAELDYISVSHALMRGGRNNWMLSRADHDLINKYTGVLYGRQMGMTTQEIAEMSTNTNKNAINKAMDAVPWLTNWIQKIDVATVGRLWYATEYWVQRHNQDYKSGKMKKGSDEYYQAVARKFEMVVTKTQPNYSVFTRPDILRSKNQLTRAVMMFKTQPLQNFNIMYESVARVNAKIRQYNQVKGTPQANAVRGELNAAWAKLARSISSQLLQTAVFTGMTFLANALILHRWDKYKDEEINEVTFASVMEQVMWDYMGSFFGNAVGGDWFEDIAEFVIRKFAFDEDVMLNGISVMGIDTINDTYELIEKITDGIQNGDPTAAWKNVIKMAQKMAAVWGIPAENILKVFESAWLYKQDIFDDYELTDVSREGIPVLFNFQETNSTQYWNRVIRAYEEGDTELVKERFKDMIENTTETETDENGKEKTKIKAVGALSKDDTEGIMEWVANKYINGTYAEKSMVEDWLEELYQYSGKPEQSIKSKKRSFYEFLGEEDKMPVELKTDDELTPAELEERKEQKKEEKWQETVATVKASVSPMSTAVSNWSSGRGYSLPIEKGDDGCGAVMAWVYQNSSDKEAVKRFAVEVMGYSQKAINRTASEWANKDLSDFK